MSDCGVCLYSDDGSTGFSNSKIRTARKTHRCSECGDAIVPGARYEFASGMCEGEFWSEKTCLICSEIADAFFCDGRTYGGIFWEWMDEVMGELTTSCFDKLTTPEAKAELQRRWIEWKGL